MSGPFGSSQWMYASGGFYPKIISGSLRFNRTDEGYLSFTPASDGNRKTWTYSTWVKRSRINDSSTLLDASVSGGVYDILYFPSTNQFRYYNNGSQPGDRLTNAKFRDTAAWYHVVLAVDTTSGTAADRIKLYINGSQITSFQLTTNFDQNDDTRINAAVEHRIGQSIQGGTANLSFDGYMAETFFIDGTAHDADAFGETKNGIWVAKNITSSNFTMGTNGWHLTFEDDSTVEAFNTLLHQGNGGTQSITGAGFSPDFVWSKARSGDTVGGHLLFDSVRGATKYLQSNSTGAEATDTTMLTSFDSDGFTLGSSQYINDSGNEKYVAWCWDAGANNASTGHSSVTYEGSGSAQDIQSLPFTPDLVWIKSRSTSTANHHLHDSVRGFSERLIANTTDAEGTNTSLPTFLKNGFRVTGSGGSYNANGVDYVAWCWDAGDNDPASNSDGTITSTVKTNGDFSIISYQGTMADANIGHGLSSAPDMIIIKNRNRSAGTNWVVFHSAMGASQRLLLNSTSAASASGNIFGSTPTAPDSTKFYVGNVNWVNNNVSNENDHIAYAWRDVAGKQKFGKYTGNASSTGPSVTLGFRPGLVMIKGLDRSSAWYVFDTSRQPFNDATNYTHKYLKWDSTDAEYTTGDDGKIEVTSTGFQVRAGVTGMNASGEEYIYAAWAGSYSDFITDVNTDGSIESRVKASDTTGHSIVSYVGTGANATVGHGLSAAPDWVLVKDRDNSNDWITWHSGLADGTQHLKLNNTEASSANATYWNSTAPSSSVISLGSNSKTNGSSQNFIAYCWTETTGVSKFGKYTGNASSTGPSVTLGFQPAFVMIKGLDRASVWYMFDTTRQTTNDATNYTHKYLVASSSNTEYTNADDGKIEITSTGFQVRASVTGMNASGEEYIYMAFADTRDAAFWLDSSSNNNDWQHVHLDHNDTVNDSPTDNHAGFNPELIMMSNASSYRGIGSFSEGNLLLTTDADNESGTIPFSASSGKYYMEFTSINLAQRQQIIVFSRDDFRGDTGAVTTSSDGGGNATDRVTWTSGDVIGIAVDVDNSKVFIHKNGEYFGTSNPVTNTGGDTLNAFTGVGVRQDSGSTGTATISFNGGQQPFEYGPPE